MARPRQGSSAAEQAREALLAGSEQAPAVPDDLSADLLAQLQRIDGGWRVRETPTHFVEVHRMLFNDRVMTVPRGNPLLVDRYWCYEPGGAALHAALLWDGGEDTEPVGWKKAHGERYPPGSPLGLGQWE